MDNIGDWFYIVLIGVFGINALIASFAKKKNVQKFPDATDDEPQFDSETNWEPEEEELIPEPETVKKEVPVSAPVYTAPIETGKSKSQYVPLSEIKQTEPQSTPIVQLDSTEDLKKAIICSEILKRKF